MANEITMADQPTMAHVSYPTLELKDSRWKRTARLSAAVPDKIDRADLAIYVPGLEVSGIDGDNLEVLRAAVSDRLLQLRQISMAYVPKGGADDSIHRVPVYGNEEAAKVMKELDELMDLARLAFPDPDQLHDWMAKAFGEHFSHALLNERGNRITFLAMALECVDSWSVARFRFLQHYMRDQPDHWKAALEPQAKAWGDDANSLVHSAAIEMDSSMVEVNFIGGREGEAMFVNSYGMTSAEARRLRHLARRSNLHQQSKDTLLWAEKMANRTVDWKVELLRAYTKQLVDTPAFRQAGAARQRDLRTEHYRGITAALGAVDRAYGVFVARVRACIEAGTATSALPPAAFRNLRAASRDLARVVANCPLNAQVHGARRAHDIRTRWPARGGLDRFSADPPGGHAARNGPLALGPLGPAGGPPRR